jgi:hypothetical protein
MPIGVGVAGVASPPVFSPSVDDDLSLGLDGGGVRFVGIRLALVTPANVHQALFEAQRAHNLM